MRGSTMRESVTDVRIILECLQEAYQMEGDMVRSGKNIHATMIYPFVRMLQEKCRDSQFIVITHRRGTMNAADRLYGITMQEKGVSTLVSVNLIENDLDK